MLDGSITPFKVRSSITIASLKAKFEPWQPMKGRALLHHSVQLDDRATLGSVPGVKNGTILRVDKQVSQVKSKTTGKKGVMSGPASSTVDEEVVESIEFSGDNEETSSESEGRLPNSKRKRALETSTEDVEDSIDDDNLANAPRSQASVLGDTSVDSLSLADTNLSSGGMAVRMAKKEKRQNTAHEHAGIWASEAQNLDHRLNSLENNPPLENAVESPTASAPVPKTEEAVSSHQDFMEDDDASFLAEIYAAAAETERPPPPLSEAGPEEDASARRCDACRRACGCGRDSLAMSNSVAPVEEIIREREAAPSNSNRNGHFTSQRAELSWTGM